MIHGKDKSFNYLWNKTGSYKNGSISKRIRKKTGNRIKRLPRQVLQEQSKKLRRSIYEIDETMKEKFPDKNTDDSLEKELKYCKQLIDVIKGNEEICSYPKVQEKLKSTRRICH